MVVAHKPHLQTHAARHAYGHGHGHHASARSGSFHGHMARATTAARQAASAAASSAGSSSAAEAPSTSGDVSQALRTAMEKLTRASYNLNPNGAQSFGNAVEEAQGGIRYIRQRYQTADNAVQFWQRHRYY
jgi:hypothetical protein